MKDRRAQRSNKCKIEASIAESTLNKDLANFTTKYYDENINTQFNPVIHYNAANPEDAPKLSIFIGLGGKSSGMKKVMIKNPEWDLIHSSVLYIMVEVKPYIE
jgi:hypothetical protein